MAAPCTVVLKCVGEVLMGLQFGWEDIRIQGMKMWAEIGTFEEALCKTVVSPLPEYIHRNGYCV